MLTYDGLKTIFGRAKKTQWILYRGQSKGQQIGSYISDEEISLEDSLAELDHVMGAYGPGVYTIECRAGKTHSKGNDLHTFTYGNPEVPSVIGKATASTTEQKFFGGLDARYFMDNQAALQQQVMQLQMEVMRKEMQIENLKRDLKDAEKPEEESAIGAFVKRNPTVVTNLINRLLPAQQPAVGTLKTNQPIPPQPDGEEDEGGATYESGRLDLNGLADAAERIQEAIPSMHVNEVLDKLADYCEANPDQAINLLKMI